MENENEFTNLPQVQVTDMVAKKWHEQFAEGATNLGKGLGGFAGGVLGGVIDPLKSETRTQTTESLQSPNAQNDATEQKRKDTIFIAVAAGLVIIVAIALLATQQKKGG